MKDNQKISHEMPKKPVEQTNNYQKNQLPPTDKTPSDAPLKETTANENKGKEESRDNTGFKQHGHINKNKRPVSGDNTNRGL